MEKVILVVEDDRLIRELVETVLETLGHRVVSASDGQEGLDAFLQQPDSIDLVISDNQMPNLLGINMVREIKSRFPDQLVLVTCGDFDQKLARAFLDANVRNFLPKPYTVPSLIDAVSRLFNGESLPLPDRMPFYESAHPNRLGRNGPGPGCGQGPEGDSFFGSQSSS